MLRLSEKSLKNNYLHNSHDSLLCSKKKSKHYTYSTVFYSILNKLIMNIINAVYTINIIIF